MSTLVVTNISDGTDQNPSQNVIYGSLFYAAEFAGSTPSTDSSFNISSITDTATALFRTNATNAAADTSWSDVGGCSTANSGSYNAVMSLDATLTTAWTDKTTTGGAYRIERGNGVEADYYANPVGLGLLA